jgi:cephamycin C biosynthesis protein
LGLWELPIFFRAEFLVFFEKFFWPNSEKKMQARPQLEMINANTELKEAINQQSKTIEGNFIDLNRFRGLGEDPVFHPPVLLNRPRFWPLDQWKDAPRDLGYDPFPHSSWKQLRLLKDPETQTVYHDILWELRPKTIVELGVYSGGSLVWFRDLAKVFSFPCKIIGVDIDLSRCQIPKNEIEMISLHQADCNSPESLSFLNDVKHPVLFVDDAHCNTFNVLKYAINNFLQAGDYVVIEDTMPLWKRYSPKHLQQHLGAFNDFLAMDLLYSNVPCQLQEGVFKVIKGGSQ